MQARKGTLPMNSISADRSSPEGAPFLRVFCARVGTTNLDREHVVRQFEFVREGHGFPNHARIIPRSQQRSVCPPPEVGQALFEIPIPQAGLDKLSLPKPWPNNQKRTEHE